MNHQPNFEKRHNMAMMDTNDHEVTKTCRNSSNDTNTTMEDGKCQQGLAQCQFIIKSLQDVVKTNNAQFQVQLASKDEHIANLEEKIIAMSLELASLKTMEDERRLMRPSVSSSSVEELMQEQVEKVQQEYAPFRNFRVPTSSSDSEKSAKNGYQYRYSPKSKVGEDIKSSADTSDDEPEDDDEENFVSWPVLEEGHSHPNPKRRGGFRLVNDLAKRMSWKGAALDSELDSQHSKALTPALKPSFETDDTAATASTSHALSINDLFDDSDLDSIYSNESGFLTVDGADGGYSGATVFSSHSISARWLLNIHMNEIDEDNVEG